MKRQAMAVVLLSVVALQVCGCSRERIDWKSAEAADTEEAYNRFLARHADSTLAAQARARLAQLGEDKDWQRATAADSAVAYRHFLSQHPSGKWAEEARIRIENFALDANPSPTAIAAEANAARRQEAGGAPADTPASAAPAADVPAASPPAPAPTAPPATTTTTGPPSKPVTTPAPAGATGYGIQLGAFGSQAAALAEWKRLQLKFESQLHGLFAHAVPVQVTSGQLFRLQAPVGEESRARSICSSLTRQAQPCVVVLPETR